MATPVILKDILIFLLLITSSSRVAASSVGSVNGTASFSGSLTGDVSDTTLPGSWCTFAQGEIYKGLITHCGLDFYAGDVGNFRVYDVDQCAKICDITPDCIAVSYQKRESGEFKGRCWLKNEITSTQRFDSSILGMYKKNISFTVPDWLEPKTASHVAHAVVPPGWSPTPLTSAPRNMNVSTTCSSAASTAYDSPSGYSSSKTLPASSTSVSWVAISTSTGPSSKYNTVRTCYSPGCLSTATPLSLSPSSGQYSPPGATYSSTASTSSTSTKDLTSNMVGATKSNNTKGTSTQYPIVSPDHSWTSAYSRSNNIATIKFSSGYGQTIDVTTSTTWTTRHVTDEVTTTTVVYRPASAKSSVHTIYSTQSAPSTSKTSMSTVEPSRQTSHSSTGASGSKTTKSPVPIISSDQTAFSTLWTTVVFTDESTTTTVVYRPASTKTSSPATSFAKTTSTTHVPTSTQTPVSTTKSSSQHSHSTTGPTKPTPSGFWMPSATTSRYTNPAPTTSPVQLPAHPSTAKSPTPSSGTAATTRTVSPAPWKPGRPGTSGSSSTQSTAPVVTSRTSVSTVTTTPAAPSTTAKTTTYYIPGPTLEKTQTQTHTVSAPRTTTLRTTYVVSIPGAVRESTHTLSGSTLRTTQTVSAPGEKVTAYPDPVPPTTTTSVVSTTESGVVSAIGGLSTSMQSAVSVSSLLVSSSYSGEKASGAGSPSSSGTPSSSTRRPSTTKSLTAAGTWTARPPAPSSGTGSGGSRAAGCSVWVVVVAGALGLACVV